MKLIETTPEVLIDTTPVRKSPCVAEGELRYCRLSSVLLRCYGLRRPRLRAWSYRLALRSEGGPFYSGTARQILAKYHGVRVGAYSYGECLRPGFFPPGVTVGRYTSIAQNVRIILHNHPMDRLSLHPFFYDADCGYLPKNSITHGALEIGHDAWIGTNTTILAGCSRIGVGSVVGAGSVVTKDVPDFAVVVGCPARILRYRFVQEVQDLILASRWWERPVHECVQFMADMVRPLSEEPWRHPLLTGVGDRDRSAQAKLA